MPAASTRSASAAGSRCKPGGAITTVAPVRSGQKNSHTDTSKPNGVFWSTRSPASIPYASCIQRRRLTIPAWVFITPFGAPVEPDV